MPDPIETAQKPPAAAPAQAPQTQKPSVGRIVLYRESGHDDCPAIVARVHSPERIDLIVFSMEYGFLRRTDVILDQGQGASRMWLWPPRV
jgi:hypothetical protein